ncbi:MAG: hypothetical protein IBX61_09560 [Thermoleophilia bacterium]|nr:hypothetical protein [Thermoleophilia bacterium]
MEKSMLTRRRLLKLGSMAGAGLLLPWQFGLKCGSEETPAPGTETATAPEALRLPADIDRFIDPLPVPAVLPPDTTSYEGEDYYEILLTQFSQKLHSQLPPTMVWGYAAAPIRARLLKPAAAAR